MLCNGLGTSPWAWPALLDPDCGVRVVSWNHRGTGGSDRPADPRRVGIEEFVEDALSVMDHFGVDRAVLMGWSMGVNTMFELAVRHPERVRGLFAVAGVPGDTFATMLGPLHLPHAVAGRSPSTAARLLKYGGRALTPLTPRLPVGPRAIAALAHTGFMFPVPDRELAATAVREFLQHAGRLVLPPRAPHLRARPGPAQPDQRARPSSSRPGGTSSPAPATWSPRPSGSTRRRTSSSAAPTSSRWSSPSGCTSCCWSSWSGSG